MSINKDRIIEFCKERYYVEDGQLCEEYENYSDRYINEMIDNDVLALEYFLKKEGA